MTPIVIPYAKTDNQDLRFALRSIDKYVPDNYVVLIGDKPEWYKGAAYPYPDKGPKEINIIRKVLYACELFPIFVFTNDDIFWLRGGDIPAYHEGTLREKQVSITNQYRRKIEATAKVIGWDALFYDSHAPMWVRAKSYIQAYKDVRTEVLSKSLHGHIAAVNPQRWVDLKINQPLRLHEIEAKLQGRQFFSVGDKGMNFDMGVYLQSLFPEKSQYEI